MNTLTVDSEHLATTVREYLADEHAWTPNTFSDDDNVTRAARQIASILNTLMAGDYIAPEPVDYDYVLPEDDGEYTDVQGGQWRLQEGTWYYGGDRNDEPKYTLTSGRTPYALWIDSANDGTGGWFPFTKVAA